MAVVWLTGGLIKVVNNNNKGGEEVPPARCRSVANPSECRDKLKTKKEEKNSTGVGEKFYFLKSYV